MARRRKLVTRIAAVLVVWLASSSAMASIFVGELPVGYSDSVFQINGGTSSLAIDVNAFGSRDPATCGSCNSSYADSYTVNLFDRTGALLESANEFNYLYYNMYSSSHGIGAGPVGITVPAGATKLEIISRLSIAGLLGPDGHPLSFGNLNISTDGRINYGGYADSVYSTAVGDRPGCAGPTWLAQKAEGRRRFRVGLIYR